MLTTHNTHYLFQNKNNPQSDEILFNKIRDTLIIYKGTRNYHNFTTKVKFSQDSAKRYISNISVELVNSNNLGSHFSIPFLLFTIEGHGFMYHQIRKMIGLIIQIMNDYYKEKDILEVFSEKKIDIWLAPGAGLFLKEV